MAKVVLFLLIPLILFRKYGFPFLRLRSTDSKSMGVAIGSGILIMSVIIMSFILLKPFINLDELIVDLKDTGVTATVFPFIAFYILFGNSLLEEFYFRGLLPSLMGNSKIRLLVPSLLFAVYHIAIFLPWFDPVLLAVAVAGLWLGGVIFQFVNEKSGTILPSWTIHMFADIGVLLVGVYIIYFY